MPNNSPAIRALEDKLITMAGFVEQLGRRIQPNENVLTEHFSGVDERLGRNQPRDRRDLQSCSPIARCRVAGTA